MHKLALLRHGESEFNRSKRFTGWIDCDLTERGVAEAVEAANLLRTAGYEIDKIYTSVLTRCRKTVEILQRELGIEDVPVVATWRLNERHYGALQGLNKSEMAARFGEQQVLAWRRSYDVRPPAMDAGNILNLRRDPKYRNVPETDLPATESLKDTVQRVVPYWLQKIAPDVKGNKRVLIVAHGNSIRALVKYLDQISDSNIVGLYIPTGIPSIYELDADLRPIRHFYLGDPRRVHQAIENAQAQGKKL